MPRSPSIALLCSAVSGLPCPLSSRRSRTRSSTRSIDVVPTDTRGGSSTRPAADFDLTENRCRCRSRARRWCGRTTCPGGGPSRNNGLFAIYLDEYYISPGVGPRRARRCRSSSTAARPDDLIVVMKLPRAVVRHSFDPRSRYRRAHRRGAGRRREDYTARNDYERISWPAIRAASTRPATRSCRR